MTGFSASCRKASPFAAPNAIFILMYHERGSSTPATGDTMYIDIKASEKKQRIDRQNEATENITIDPSYPLAKTLNKLVATTKPEFKIRKENVKTKSNYHFLPLECLSRGILKWFFLGDTASSLKQLIDHMCIASY